MKDFKGYFTIPAPPAEVYAALTNEATMRLWTGDTVSFSAEPGSEFSMWDGSIVGKNLSFEQGKKLVQEWFFGEQPVASIVTITLHEHKKGTSLELRHTNIPDEDFDDMVEGWEDVYMASLIEFYS